MQNYEMDPPTNTETTQRPTSESSADGGWREAQFMEMVGTLVVDNGGSEVSALND